MRRTECRDKQPRDKQARYRSLLSSANLLIYTDSEKLLLLKRVRANDTVAIEKMILSHVRLAISIANRYIGTYELHYYDEDLDSAAIEGVVNAVNRVAKGGMNNHDNITGYIVMYVHQFIIVAINHSSTVYTPRRRKSKPIESLPDTLTHKDSQLDIQELEAWDLIESLTDNKSEKKILKLRSKGFTDAEIGEIVKLPRLQVFRIRHNLFRRYQREVKNG